MHFLFLSSPFLFSSISKKIQVTLNDNRKFFTKIFQKETNGLRHLMKKELTRPRQRKNRSLVRRQNSLAKRVCRALMGIVFSPFILSNMIGIYLLKKFVPHSYQWMCVVYWWTYSAIDGYFVGMLSFVELVNIISLLWYDEWCEKEKTYDSACSCMCVRKSQASKQQTEETKDEDEEEETFLSILYA